MDTTHSISLNFLIYIISLKYLVAYYSPHTFYGVPINTIPIGLITDQYNSEMNIVFDHAIEIANSQPGIFLSSVKREVSYGDSFQAYGILCEMLQVGVSGIFGPSSKHTAAHLMTVCDAKDIPYAYSYITENSEGFNLSPHPMDLANALHSIITAFEWSRFIFLYESVEYLNILNGLMSFYGNNGPIITVLRYDLQLNGDYKPVLRRIRKSVDNRIVVLGSTESLPELLKQALQVGIINEEYKYIIGNLDLQAFDLEEYKYSEANITGIRMFSSEQTNVRKLMEKLKGSSVEEELRSCAITLEMALIYDAVQLFAETSKHIIFQPVRQNCSDRTENVNDGSTFKNYMRTQNIQASKTITGRIYFEGNVRKGFQFDVIELQPSGIVKVGSWDEINNYTLFRLPQTNSAFDTIDHSLANKTFTVLLSVPNKPYASLVESHKKLDGNNQYEGFGVDLIKLLAEKLGFDIILKNGGNDYGSFNSTTNVSTGMLKKIVEGEAEFAVTDLTITAERAEAVDFSIPFMNLGIAILYLKPQKSPPALFSFMDPFSSEVWLYLGLSYLCVSISIFILGRLSPTEWNKPSPCIEDPTKLENQFTLSNSLWFTTGALLQQGSDISPKALSTRTVAYIWWFFTLIMVSSYTANLASFLTIENPTSLIESVDDLAENKGGVKFGAKKTGSTRDFFLTTEDKRYKKMNEFMLNNPEYLTESNQEGVDRVKNSNRYAFLMESTSIEYNTMRECNLKKIGDALDEKVYGIAMRKNWPYQEKINKAILELQEQGVLAKLKNKWWNEVGAGICTSKSEKSEVSELDIDNLSGIYFVLVVGSCLALIYGITIWVLFVSNKSRQHNLPLRDVFIKELNIVLDFTTYSRELNNSSPANSRSRNSSFFTESLEADTKTLRNI